MSPPQPCPHLPSLIPDHLHLTTFPAITTYTLLLLSISAQRFIMRTLLLITFAVLTRAVLQPASPITRLLTKTLAMAHANIDLLRRAVSNDARNSHANGRNAPDPRNTDDDRKLKTILPTFCKYHHSHAGCPPTLRGNANYKRLLQEGLKRMPAAMWLKGELEEIYPRWFDEYCAGG